MTEILMMESIWKNPIVFIIKRTREMITYGMAYKNIYSLQRYIG